MGRTHTKKDQDEEQPDQAGLGWQANTNSVNRFFSEAGAEDSNDDAEETKQFITSEGLS